METMISVVGLNASYDRGAKRVQALRDVNLTIEAGEIFGLLGPNGAGKTTFLSCLEGLHRPETGEINVAGYSVWDHSREIKQRLGIQLQRTALMDDLTAGELLRTYAALYEVYLTRADVRERLNQVDLQDMMDRYPRRMSGGQQQRLALALAVINDPKVVLLDEPTGQLDPHARRAVWELVRRMRSDGRTVLITTHAMEEAEALCGRVAILDSGRVITCGTPASLIASLDAGAVLKISLEVSLDLIHPLPGVRSARYSGQNLEIETSQPQETLAALQSLAGQLGRRMGDVMLRQPNLEDVFLRLTGRTLDA